MKKTAFILAVFVLAAALYVFMVSPAPEMQVGQEYSGYLVVGNEVRTFRPCGEGQPDYWIVGDSPALSALKDAYTSATADVLPAAYAPLYAVITGEVAPRATDGFGADYENAMRITELKRSDRIGNCKENLIVVTSPLAGADVSSPLTITGRARGNWFFEASFPISLVDWDGKIIAQGVATATSDWMTSEFVPFTATLTYKVADISGQYSNRGALILKKDNPSGLPEHDDALEMPVVIR